MKICESRYIYISILALFCLLSCDTEYKTLKFEFKDPSQITDRTISVESENALITPHPENVDVETDFTFLNNGPPVEVEMTFPLSESSNQKPGLVLDGEYNAKDISELSPDQRDKYDEYLSSTYGVDTKNPVKETILERDYDDFKVTTGEEQIPVEYVAEIELVNGKYLEKREFTRWKLKFKQGETKKITCQYRIPYYCGEVISETPLLEYPITTGDGSITIKRSLTQFNAPLFFLPPGANYELKRDKKSGLDYVESDISIGEIKPAVVKVSDNVEEITWRFEELEPTPESTVRIYVGTTEHFTGSSAYEELYTEFTPGITLKNGQNFRISPSLSADLVPSRPQLNEGVIFSIVKARGEWWMVRLDDKAEGWIRWRYLDPDTGELYIHASLLLLLGY